MLPLGVYNVTYLLVYRILGQALKVWKGAANAPNPSPISIVVTNGDDRKRNARGIGGRNVCGDRREPVHHCLGGDLVEAHAHENGDQQEPGVPEQHFFNFFLPTEQCMPDEM